MQRNKRQGGFGDRYRRDNGRYNKRQRPNSDHPRSSAPPIDRTKTCPMLLRIFPRVNGHNIFAQYYKSPTDLPPDEIQVHTWQDATLMELGELIMEVRPEARDAKLGFAVIWPDFKRGGMLKKDVGMVSSYQKGRDDTLTLGQLAKKGFTTGDFIDVAILPRNHSKSKL